MHQSSKQRASPVGQPTNGAQSGASGAELSDYQALQFVRSGVRLIYQAEREESPAIPVNIGSETLSNSGSVMAIVFGVAKLRNNLIVASGTSHVKTGKAIFKRTMFHVEHLPCGMKHRAAFIHSLSRGETLLRLYLLLTFKKSKS